MSRRRAVVLIVIQLLIIAHVTHWLVFGRTITPVEPSESIQAFTRSMINAGLVFFALALASTAALGRWMCGWACHVVMLQDFCAWLMKMAGIRPRPFRSRLMMFGPLLLAFYMFLWPAVYRWLIAPITRPDARWPAWHTEFVSDDFWATFPSIAIAIPFLFVCGFVTVYFLGSKGFCTYGCPYGGFFAPLDRLSPLRVRVDHDRCDACGHCTATCTSNVRIHEEIKVYGMVVDPGCMKCMDCISVCPTDALSMSLGRPAVHAPLRPGHQAPTRRFDLTWTEEIGLALLTLVGFMSFRGLYEQIPLLMAMGMSICLAYIVWIGSRLLSPDQVRVQRLSLKPSGRKIRPIGFLWGLAAVLALIFTAQSALVQYHGWRGESLAGQIAFDPQSVFRGAPGISMYASDRAKAGLALAHLKKADAWRVGGIGLAQTPGWTVAQARLFLAVGDVPAASDQLHRAIVKGGQWTDLLCADYGRLLAVQGRVDEALAWYESVLAEHSDFGLVRRILIAGLMQQGRTSDAQRYRDGA